MENLERNISVSVQVILSSYFVIGLGKQVHFSQSINKVISEITKPDARNTLNLESVLNIGLDHSLPVQKLTHI